MGDSGKTNSAGARRADIQGLRAIAVGLVIADHLFGQPIGGFIGVDVFFVISGFLITGLLLREGEKTGHVSIVNFYKRRARRILPAALVVLAVTLVVASVIFSTSRYESTLEDTIWALIFLENWHLASVGTDYFQSTLPPSPVQHFWSLAVEEQFYVVWPLLLVALLWGARRAAGRGNEVRIRVWTGAFAAVVIASSFGWAIYQSGYEPTVAYFSAFTRAWELGAGALLAAAGPALMRRANAVVRNALVVVGMTGLVASALIIGPEDPFPAPIGALPVVATVLLLAAGIGSDGRVMAARPLTLSPLIYMGAISYSLYLWHWPVIIFLTAVMDQTTTYYVLALGLTAVASVLSYHLVEQGVLKSQLLAPHPAVETDERAKAAEKNRVEWLTFGATAVAVTVVAALAFHSTRTVGDDALEAQVEQQRALEAAAASGGDWLQAALVESLEMTEYPALSPPLDDPTSDMAAEMVGDAQCLNPTEIRPTACTYGPDDAKKTAVVVGDSIAISWMPGIRDALPRWRVQGIGLSNCPFADVDVTLNVADQAERCGDDYDEIIDQIVDMRPDMVIASSAEFSINMLASGATEEAATEEWRDGVADWARRLKPSGAELVVLSPMPAGAEPSACYTTVAGPADCVTESISPLWFMKSDAESGVPGVSYVDTRSWFCVGSKCPIFAAGTTMRWDSAHLTASYAELIASKLRASLVGEPESTEG